MIFDVNPKKIAQDYRVEKNVRPLLSSVDIKRADNGEFFRAHPDEAYSFRLLILDNQYTLPHVVAPHLEEQLIGIAKRKILVTVITSHGEIKLHPVLETYTDNWNKTAHQALQLAKSEWIQMTSNKSMHNYELSSSSVIDTPVWPDITPSEIFNAAFSNQCINDMSHPVISKLKGK